MPLYECVCVCLRACVHLNKFVGYDGHYCIYLYSIIDRGCQGNKFGLTKIGGKQSLCRAVASKAAASNVTLFASIEIIAQCISDFRVSSALCSLHIRSTCMFSSFRHHI